MLSSKLAIIFAAVGIIALFSSPLFGQATFTVASSPSVGTDIGATELTGAITLTVASGVSAAAGFAVQYSATVSNDFASGITISGTGPLAGVTASLNRENNLVIVNVPLGGGLANSITIAGVRVALAGKGYQTVTANIAAIGSTGNSIVAGQNNVTVIGAIQQPFSLTQSSTSNTGSILVQENYAHAFTSDIGLYGQTVATRLRINAFPAIPSGVKLTFPQKVTSPEDGAMFTTTSGLDETIPRSDGSTTVTYIYTGPGTPSALRESFDFIAVVAIEPPTPGGTIAFQVTLLPIGIAIPDADFPSTDIPRYTERKVPDATDISTGSSKLAFPFQAQSAGTYTGIALTNSLDYPVKVNLTAFNSSGIAVTNPVIVIMPERTQLAKLATEIFGQDFNASGPGTITAVAQAPDLAGFYLEGSTTGQGLDGTTGDVSPLQSWVWPSVSRLGLLPYTRLQMFNPGTGVAQAALKLYDASGNLVASAAPSIPAGGTVIRDLREVFPGIDLTSFAGGYVTGDSDFGLVVSENYGNALESNLLQGQTGHQQVTYNIAHFASGGGYTTELNLVNLDSVLTAKVTISLLDTTGALFTAAENPLQLSISPKSQSIKTIDQLFPSLGSASLRTGYIRMEVEISYIGPFGSPVPLAGSVRFSATDSSGSAALPIFLPATQDLVFSHIAQNLGYYTGVAVLNPASIATSVQVEAFTKDGLPLGSYTTTLQPAQKIAKLLYEIIPTTANQLGGYIRIHSELPVVSFSLFGSTDGKVLSAIPPQRVVP